ncbi:hypothetical protein [Halobaculum gomorrense]|uniref:Uncharacterized protein n=1 Tax=Halobaculum gomorrense TaxID=43928 RepID=A0A1M5TPZ8_9EURY|nr:hypothetical protein [Halobaculum gomorrense]SHH52761.1 hypothetical protein SAMN05443636_2797 [Halobaculum gomorrense]
MGDDTRLRDRITWDRLLLAAVLVVGIAGTGVVRRQLGVLGYNDLGRIVFIFGYGLTVFAVWYGWIRPIDITGPSARREVPPSGSSRGPGGGASSDKTDAGRDGIADDRSGGSAEPTEGGRAGSAGDRPQ